MAITRSITRNQNHDDKASCSKTFKTDDVGPWSDVNGDLLLLILMQLGVVDFLAFSAVCKSWRSVALPNKNQFMASQPPMLIYISPRCNDDMECYLEDSEGRKFKTMLPQFAFRSWIGLTCGYLILLRMQPKDFWLVNPITRHELHFPPVPCDSHLRPVLVFSPSISRYMFVMLDIARKRIWYSIEGEGAWKFVSSTQHFQNLHAFNGKIYTISSGKRSWKVRRFCELTFTPEPKLIFLKTKNFLNQDLYLAELVNSGENLYLVRSLSRGLYEVRKLDFGKMEWEMFKDARDELEHEHAFFLSGLNYGAVVKPESWADPQSQHGRFNRHGSVFTARQWYFPHECLNVESLR